MRKGEMRSKWLKVVAHGTPADQVDADLTRGNDIPFSMTLLPLYIVEREPEKVVACRRAWCKQGIGEDRQARLDLVVIVRGKIKVLFNFIHQSINQSIGLDYFTTMKLPGCLLNRTSNRNGTASENSLP